jgi:hypothetical protein
MIVKIFGAVFLSTVVFSAQASAAIVDVLGADLVHAFATAQDGDTLRVLGDVGSVTLRDRSFTIGLTIDGSSAQFTDTLTIRDVSNLKIVDGIIGSSVDPLRGGAAIVARDSSKLTFFKNTFAGDGSKVGLSLTNVDTATVYGGRFIGLKAGIAVASSSDVLLQGNDFLAMTSDGIDIADSHRVKAIYNNCSEVQPRMGAHPDCIQLWSFVGKPMQSDIVITRNVVRGFSQGLTSFDPDQASGLRISITENNVRVGFPHGISCYGCVDSNISNNIVSTIPGARFRTSIRTPGGSNNIVENNYVGPRSAIGSVPEPMIWAQLILGFGLVGGLARRRRSILA